MRKGSHHSMETRAKISKANLGKHLSDEHKQKLREANLGKHRSEETKAKISKSEFGKHLSEESKQKISEANLGKRYTEESKAKMSEAHLGLPSPMKGKHHSEESKSKMSIAKAGENHPLFGKHPSSETKIKMSKSYKKLWQDPQFAKRAFEAFSKTPNKPEKALIKMLDSNFQGEWKFVGDGQFTLGGLCPDFININGKKKIIEMFGTYWHRDRENIKYYQTEYGRREIFARYGFQLLVIWEDELKDKDAIIKKVRKFMKC